MDDLGFNVGSDNAWIGFKPSVGIWEASGEEVKFTHMLLDPSSLKTGWIQIQQGVGPDCHWDEAVGKVGNRPSEDHRRGFQVMVYLKEGGWHQWQQNQVGVLQGFATVWAEIKAQMGSNEDKVAVIKYNNFEINSKGKGTTRIPKLELVKWQDYPKDEESASPPPPVKESTPAPSEDPLF